MTEAPFPIPSPQERGNLASPEGDPAEDDRNGHSQAPTRGLPPRLLITASAWLSRIVGLGVQVYALRCLLSTLGSERYAVFALLASLLPWYALADIGIGYAVQNSVTERQAKNLPFREIVVSGLATGIVALLGGVLLLVALAPVFAPQFLVQFPMLGRAEKIGLFLASGLLMSAATTTAIGAKCWYAVKMGHVANLLNIAGSAALMVGLVAAGVSPSLQTLTFYVCLFAGVPAVTGLISVAAFWRAYRLTIGDFRREAIHPIWERAKPFALNTALVIAVLEVKYLIMSQLVGSRDIVFYNVVDRVFLGAYLLYVAALQALWPEVTELSAHNRQQEILRLILRYITLGATFMLLTTLVFAILKPAILTLLSPHEALGVPTSLILWFGLQYTQYAVVSAFGVALQSMSKMKSFNIALCLQAAVSIPLQWYLTSALGVRGLIVATFVSTALTIGWVCPLLVIRQTRLRVQS